MLAWGLGYFGMPQVLLRFMAIRKENELKRSRRIAMVWVVISLGVAVFIGNAYSYRCHVVALLLGELVSALLQLKVELFARAAGAFRPTLNREWALNSGSTSR